MFIESEDFDFLPTLEQNWRAIRDEVDQLRHGDFSAWPEYHLYRHDDKAGEGWDVFGLVHQGRALAQNCAKCPRTVEVVQRIPGLYTAGFSLLRPGTHILPHTGYTDKVLRCHLGLVTPPDCALRVGSQTRAWREGETFVFDDTTEHEAWNRSNDMRVVLLIDFQKDTRQRIGLDQRAALIDAVRRMRASAE